MAQKHLETSSRPVQQTDFDAARAIHKVCSRKPVLELLACLAQRQMDVSSLAQAVGKPVPTVSRALQSLRIAGLVSVRSDGHHQVHFLSAVAVVERRSGFAEIRIELLLRRFIVFAVAIPDLSVSTRTPPPPLSVTVSDLSAMASKSLLARRMPPLGGS